MSYLKQNIVVYRAKTNKILNQYYRSYLKWLTKLQLENTVIIIEATSVYSDEDFKIKNISAW